MVAMPTSFLIDREGRLAARFEGGDASVHKKIETAVTTLLAGGTLRPGAPADIVVIDLDTPWVVDPAKLRSSCKNTPFDEAKFMGGAVRTIAGGRTVFQRAMP